MSDSNESFVKEAYRKYDTMTPVELVKAMYAQRLIKDAKEAELKEINAEYDFLRNVKIPKVFEEQELQLLKVDGVGRCNLTGDLQAAIPADKKEEAYSWLRDNGREDIIQETVNSSTLKAMVKAMMQKGEAVPDCFRVHVFSRASITKA